MRRLVVAGMASAFLALSVAPLASAGTLKPLSKWRDCESQQSGLTYRTTFNNVADWYGSGRYMIKSEVRWDRYAFDRWYNRDTNTISTNWLKITNPQYDFSHFHGDKTGWGTIYSERWRAHVIVKLLKNRKGPKDKRVDIVHSYFEKGFFPERGNCAFQRSQAHPARASNGT